MSFRGLQRQVDGKRKTQMEMQEQLIAQKQKEIRDKIAKNKQQELAKLAASSKTFKPKPQNSYGNSDNTASKKNFFRNDGSFMDTFKTTPGGYSDQAAKRKNSMFNSLKESYLRNKEKYARGKSEESNTSEYGSDSYSDHQSSYSSQMSYKEDDYRSRECDERLQDRSDSSPSYSASSKASQPTSEVDWERADQLASVVAQCGDELEESARKKHVDTPGMWFLQDKESWAYKIYRKKVNDMRSNKATAAASSSGDSSEEPSAKRRCSRWGEQTEPAQVQPQQPFIPNLDLTVQSVSMMGRNHPAMVAYAMRVFNKTDLTEEQWKQCEDQIKMGIMFQEMKKKKDEAAKVGKYEYDSDEEIDDEGTWEHKRRAKEMHSTLDWASDLTEKAEGKHHIGDFLPPEELEKFIEKYEALKEGRNPDLSDYKDFKLTDTNVGYQMLQKMGWNEGKGLGSQEEGIQHPVNQAIRRVDNQGLGVEKPEDVARGDDEYEAYRKRMMLAYRFRPNPLNNPRRAYY